MHPSDFCYICGHNGPTEITHTRPVNGNNSSSTTSSKIPYFPSLLLVPPAASSKAPSAVDGHVRLCLLCLKLLIEQWKAYEKRKTPLSNRQYWFKCCSANRDAFESSIGPRSGINRSAGGADAMELSRSPSPQPEDIRNALFNRSSDSATSSGAVKEFQQSSASKRKFSGTPTESKLAPDVGNRSPCVVCANEIESMDVCRRLPAHLVAQIADLKPSLTQAVGQSLAIANLTGEVLVCDGCFASPSFQSAWLDCCRRGSVPVNSASLNFAQRQPSSNPGDRQELPLPNETTSMQALFAGALPNQQNLTEAQRQWFALYERALLQFNFTGQLDPIPNMVGQLQQLAAAEALASLQHSGAATDRENANRSSDGEAGRLG